MTHASASVDHEPSVVRMRPRSSMMRSLALASGLSSELERLMRLSSPGIGRGVITRRMGESGIAGLVDEGRARVTQVDLVGVALGASSLELGLNGGIVDSNQRGAPAAKASTPPSAAMRSPVRAVKALPSTADLAL